MQKQNKGVRRARFTAEVYSAPLALPDLRSGLLSCLLKGNSFAWRHASMRGKHGFDLAAQG